ncbi:MAG: acyl-CoA dehydrogenase [Gammaproteobacteria bacterium]
MTQAATTLATDDGDIVSLLDASATDFCARALPRTRLRALRGARPAFDRAAWRDMAELGWTGLALPEDRGGLGVDACGIAAVCRRLGGAIAPEPLVETAIAAATLLAEAGADDDWLTPLLSGERVITVAFPGAGDSLPVARGDGAALRLAGRAGPVPLGADADAWLLPVMLEGEFAWCEVARDAPGLTLVDLPLADGSRDARLEFSAVPARLLALGATARAAGERARQRAGFAAGAYALGLADALFALTLDYLGTRRQFGQAIGSFQALQHRAVDLYLQLRLAQAVLTDCAALIDHREHAARAASRVRLRCVTAALLVAREAVQMHGGIGYTDDCDVGLFLNRALVNAARYGGAAEHRRALAALRAASPASDADETLAVDIERDAPDGDWNALSDAEFRAVVRGWFRAHYPEALRNPPARLRWAECRDWYARLHARGWAAPGWPRQWGGMGLNADKLLIFTEERERHGVARTPDQGIIMIGPVLMRYGSEAQQAFYLPRALSGEHIWCQGYSEPNAGSDLASLRTRAVKDGEDYVITGQKIWTTLAQDATHMFCLVRTDPDAKPQAGISFVLIDMQTPGITIRPIRNLAGDEEFCEVFLDEVRVPQSARVGRENDGWTIAKALLGFERLFVGSPKTCQYALNRLETLAAARDLFVDPVFADRHAGFAAEVADLEALYKEFAAALKRGETIGADVSLLKVFASETFARLSEFILESAGEAGAQVGLAAFGAQSVDVLSPYYQARPTPIYGGSNEIQRNILAKQVLNLPSR